MQLGSDTDKGLAAPARSTFPDLVALAAKISRVLEFKLVPKRSEELLSPDTGHRLSAGQTKSPNGGELVFEPLGEKTIYQRPQLKNPIWNSSERDIFWARVIRN